MPFHCLRFWREFRSWALSENLILGPVTSVPCRFMPKFSFQLHRYSRNRSSRAASLSFGSSLPPAAAMRPCPRRSPATLRASAPRTRVGRSISAWSRRAELPSRCASRRAGRGTRRRRVVPLAVSRSQPLCRLASPRRVRSEGIRACECALPSVLLLPLHSLSGGHSASASGPIRLVGRAHADRA